MSLSQLLFQKSTSLIAWARTFFWQKALKQTWSRFPLSILSLVVLTVSWLLIIDFTSGVCCLDGFRLYLFENMYFFFRLAIVSAIGVGLFTTIRLYWEARQENQNALLVYYATGLIILGLVFLIFPWQVQELASQYIYQTFLLGLVVACLFSIVPFVYSSTNQGVWSFWFSLGKNFGVAYAFGLIIYLGLSAALSLTSLLFNLGIDPKIYVMLLILSMITFSIWYFLADLPEIKPELAQKEVDYPKYLRILAKYILPFIFGVYLIILYVYSLRILITQDWLSNQVASTVIWLVIIGFSIVMLLFPLLEEQWSRRLTRVVLVSILPIMLIYFWSVGIRISGFGWTIERYLLVIFGVWAVLVSVYFLIAKKPLLKVLPLSIVLILLLSSFGPWGVFAVSKADQLQRLKDVLQAQGLLVNGKIKPTDRALACSEEAKINNLVEYLVSNHGISTLKDLYDPKDWSDIMQKINLSLELTPEGAYYYYQPFPNFNWAIAELVEHMGLKRYSDYNCDWQLNQNSSLASFSYQTTGTQILKISDSKDGELYYFQLSYFDIFNSTSPSGSVHIISLGKELELVAIKGIIVEGSKLFQDLNQLDKDFSVTSTPFEGVVGLNLRVKNQPQTAVDLINSTKQSILRGGAVKHIDFSGLSYGYPYISLQDYFGKKPFTLLDQELIGNQKVTVVLTNLKANGQYTRVDGQDSLSLELILVEEIQGFVLINQPN